jgi:hypothetical protein
MILLNCTVSKKHFNKQIIHTSKEAFCIKLAGLKTTLIHDMF